MPNTNAAAATVTAYNTVISAIKDAAPDRDVALVAVSKTYGPEAIRPVLDAGQRLFGENRVQEAEDKWPAMKQDFPDIDLHLIGPLQSNKAKNAVALFDTIQSVDRFKIAHAIAREAERQDRNPDIFIQVNIGEEPQKAGVLPTEIDMFITEIRDNIGLNLKGLMCIPPVDEPAAPYFALLAKMAARNGVTGLSMGMSSDFETAIRFGATHVRVGSAIFGSRPPIASA